MLSFYLLNATQVMTNERMTFVIIGEGKAFKAYEVLKDCQSNANRYKFALTCLKLNKLPEAEKALLNRKNARPLQQQDQNSMLSQVPNGAAGLYLLGLVCEKQIKRKEAVDYYSKALLLDPTLWCAFERLSKLQMNIDPNKLFNENHPNIQKMNHNIREFMQMNLNRLEQIQASPGQTNPSDKSHSLTMKTPNIAAQKSPSNQDMKENQQMSAKKGTLNITTSEGDMNNNIDEDSSFHNELKTPTGQSSGQYITPTNNMNNAQTKKLGQNAPSQQHHQSRITGNVSDRGQNPVLTGSGLDKTQNLGGMQGNQLQFQLDDSMLLGQQNPIQSFLYPPNSMSDPVIKPFTISTPNLQNMPPPQSMNPLVQSTPMSQHHTHQQQHQQVSSFDAPTNPHQQDDLNKSQKLSKKVQQIPSQQQQLFTLQALLNSQVSVDIQDLMSLLKVLGHAFLQLCLYRCQESVKIFGKLPKKQYNTGWVLAQIGKCYFEMSKYQEAEKFYKKVITVEPYRLEGLEYYSTCLWHLKKQVDLCYLSNHALEKSLFAPETWCVVGNCYSLQKEHETALKFFNRAIQINNQFAYAHTLSGHEYVANEDFDQAKKCYQKALTSDERHYNAWWGLGNICLKQEKFEQAAQLFTSAIQINQRSSVLYTYLGMTKHNCSQPLEALQFFERSEMIDPNNSLNKFQKANVLIALDRQEEALQVLLDLLQQVPKEAPIHILIGKIYRRMGVIDKALQYFTKALDLDPKDTNMVKSLIDKIHSQAPGNNGLGGDINEDADIQIL